MERKGMIVIADPDAVWSDSMARLLGPEGYAVVVARTGVDALFQARMRRPDLILLAPDISPLGGWEICRRLKRSAEIRQAKVVLLTLDGGRAYRAGADGYLAKGAQAEQTLPPVHAFRHPAPGILEDFQRRRQVLAA